MDLITLALAKKYANKKFADILSFGGFEIVEELPLKDISSSAIYLLLKQTTEEGNLYDEYIYTLNGQWEKIGSTVENGATFIPNISDDGILSWTNDKGLVNPSAVNIKGPQGDSGVYVGRGDMPENCNVQIDPDGEPYSYKLTESEKEEIIDAVLAHFERAEDWVL